eukprot:364444-Chlamydomonas_euryale.AAC.4
MESPMPCHAAPMRYAAPSTHVPLDLTFRPTHSTWCCAQLRVPSQPQEVHARGRRGLREGDEHTYSKIRMLALSQARTSLCMISACAWHEDGVCRPQEACGACKPDCVLEGGDCIRTAGL